MDPDNVIGLVVPLLFILGIGAAIAGGVYMMQAARRGEKQEFPTRTLFRTYLALLSIVSLLLMVGGVGHLVNAGMSAGLSRDFSYYPLYSSDDFKPRPFRIPLAPEPPTLAEELTAAEQEALQKEQEDREEKGLKRAFQEGLLKGLSFTFFGGILWGAHVWGRRKIETDEERKTSLMSRVYMLVLVLIFGIITVSSLPSGAFESLRFYVLDQDFRQPPGEKLATAIVALPIWLLYLKGNIQAIRG